MKTVVITGSTRGIGLEMAKVFLSSGCKVTISGRRADIPEETKEALAGSEANYIYISCNVQHKEDIENLWIKTKEKWGNIDLWINNAGQNAPYEHIWETTDKDLNAVIDTNIKGMIMGSQVAAAHMMKQGSGQIFNMEGLGSNSMIQKKAVLYGMTKSALTYFTKGLAKELEGSGILAGRLSPGMMLTEFITKSPSGEESPVMNDPQFKKVFNILADKPETVAAYLVPKMLANTKQDAHIMWLTNLKASLRFMSAPFRKRKLI